MKHAGTGANYVLLNKQIKLQHEKNPASYLKSMQNVGFEKTSTRFIEMCYLKITCLQGKKM